MDLFKRGRAKVGAVQTLIFGALAAGTSYGIVRDIGHKDSTSIEMGGFVIRLVLAVNLGFVVNSIWWFMERSKYRYCCLLELVFSLRAEVGERDKGLYCHERFFRTWLHLTLQPKLCSMPAQYRVGLMLNQSEVERGERYILWSMGLVD